MKPGKLSKLALDVTGGEIDSLPDNTTFLIRSNEFTSPSVPSTSIQRRFANAWLSAFDHGDEIEHRLVADGPVAYGDVFFGTFQQCLDALPECKTKNLHRFQS